MERPTPNAQRSKLDDQPDICALSDGFVIVFRTSRSTFHYARWNGAAATERVDKTLQVRRRICPAHVENCARTSADTRTGRPVCASIGHQRVRASDKSRPSRLQRISVNRSNVSRVALPTQVRSTTSSPNAAGALYSISCRKTTQPTASCALGLATARQ